MNPIERGHVLDLYLIDLPEIDHIPSTVNMVNIRPVDGALLSMIREESTGSVIGSTRTDVILTTVYEQEFPESPVVLAAPSSTSATMKRRLPWRRFRKEKPGKGGMLIVCAPRRHGQPQPHNLEDAFEMVGNQSVFRTPSANITIAINELAKL